MYTLPADFAPLCGVFVKVTVRNPWACVGMSACPPPGACVVDPGHFSSQAAWADSSLPSPPAPTEPVLSCTGCQRLLPCGKSP